MHQQRTLAAIMFTDIVGYTAIMGADEEYALQLIEENKETHLTFIRQHGGSYIKEIGDGTLATFPTASEAVQCALDIQQKIRGKYKLRIGIHLAEIVIAENDVFGDGVNIASRIEHIAPSGGIYVSEAVFSSIRNLQETKTRFEGDILFKNVATRTKIYSIVAPDMPLPERGYFRSRKEQIEKKSSIKSIVLIASVLALAFFGAYQLNLFGLNPKSVSAKTIAVLPFEARGNQDEYLSEGITDDILNQLIKIKELKIIARSNLRSYDYSNKSYTEIGNDLDVANILVGTVTKDSVNIRITAQLINTLNEEILWSNTYNKPFEDVFQIQNEVAISIARALKAKISTSEASNLSRAPTSNMNAYDLYLKGKEYYARYTEADNISAIELFRQALNLDPDFVLAYAGLSDAFSQLAQKSNIKEIWLDSAYYYANVIQTEDPSMSVGFKSMGLYYSIIGNTPKAIDEFKRAVEIDNNVEAVINLSRLYYRGGQLEDAIKLLHDSQWYHPMNADLWFNFGATYYRLKDFEQALTYLDKALFINPNHINSLLLKWFISVLTNQNEEAFTVAQKLGFIGDDDTDKLLMNLQEILQNKQADRSAAAKSIYEILEEREVDYIDLPYLFNLIGYTYFTGGMEQRARALFEYKLDYNLRRLEEGDGSYKLRYEIAQIFAITGNPDESMKWLEDAFQNGWCEFPFGYVDPSFDSLQSNEQFNKIIQKSMQRLDAVQLNLTPFEEIRPES